MYALQSTGALPDANGDPLRSRSEAIAEASVVRGTFGGVEEEAARDAKGYVKDGDADCFDKCLARCGTCFTRGVAGAFLVAPVCCLGAFGAAVSHRGREAAMVDATNAYSAESDAAVIFRPLHDTAHSFVALVVLLLNIVRSVCLCAVLGVLRFPTCLLTRLCVWEPAWALEGVRKGEE